MNGDGWRECRLGDLLEVKHGYAFKGEFFGDQGSHIVLTPGNFYDKGGFKAKDGKEKWYSGPIPQEYVLRQGDVVVAMTEQSEGLLGSSAIVPTGGLYLHNQRIGLVAPRLEMASDSRFLYYLFNTLGVRSQIRASASGAKIRHTAPSRIADVRVAVPDPVTQRRVADILTAYDDLIARNLRRIEILEEMARAIYREWFVSFRFPDYERVRVIDAALGLMPEAWRITTIGEEFRTVLGGTPSRSEPSYWINGTVPWINSGKVNDLRVIEPSEWITEEALARSATKLMPRGTTLVAITGATLGQVSYLELECCANQSVVGIVDDAHLYSEWIYLMLQDRIREVIQHASGGAQQHINKEIVNAVAIALPPEEIGQRFKDVVAPMFELLTNLLHQNQNLRATRDLLLPRLMSGRLTLAEAGALAGV